MQTYKLFTLLKRGYLTTSGNVKIINRDIAKTLFQGQSRVVSALGGSYPKAAVTITGYIARGLGSKIKPDSEITSELIRKHVDDRAIFQSASVDIDIAKGFMNDGYSDSKKGVLSEIHPAFLPKTLICVRGTLGSGSWGDIEKEICISHIPLYSIRHLTINGIRMNNPLYIKLQNDDQAGLKSIQNFSDHFYFYMKNLLENKSISVDLGNNILIEYYRALDKLYKEAQGFSPFKNKNLPLLFRRMVGLADGQSIENALLHIKKG